MDFNQVVFHWEKKSYCFNLWQSFVVHLLKKAIETTELKNTMVRIKDFGLIQNETQSLSMK